jgi:hypothetical protein
MTSDTMRTLVATDLARADARDATWYQSRTGCQSVESGQWITSVGYRFAEQAAPPAADALHVVIRAPDRKSSAPPCDSQTCRRLTLATAGGEIAVEVGPSRAGVGIEAAHWTACAAPILVAISVCWRFEEIDRTLDEFAAWTRSRLHGGQGSRELGPRFRALHALIVDLPCFEGVLDDPSAYFASVDEVRLFRRLARRLQLAAWRARLDERIEILEAAGAALVDERRHWQLLNWEIALELLILVALLTDIGIHLALALLE